MKRSIELPEKLAELIEEYLKERPYEELCGLLQSTLAIKPEFKDLSGLLALSGIVKQAPRNAADHAEDCL